MSLYAWTKSTLLWFKAQAVPNKYMRKTGAILDYLLGLRLIIRNPALLLALVVLAAYGQWGKSRASEEKQSTSAPASRTLPASLTAPTPAIAPTSVQATSTSSGPASASCPTTAPASVPSNAVSDVIGWFKRQRDWVASCFLGIITFVGTALLISVASRGLYLFRTFHFLRVFVYAGATTYALYLVFDQWDVQELRQNYLPLFCPLGGWTLDRLLGFRKNKLPQGLGSLRARHRSILRIVLESRSPHTMRLFPPPEEGSATVNTKTAAKGQNPPSPSGTSQEVKRASLWDPDDPAIPRGDEEAWRMIAQEAKEVDENLETHGGDNDLREMFREVSVSLWPSRAARIFTAPGNEKAAISLAEIRSAI